MVARLPRQRRRGSASQEVLTLPPFALVAVVRPVPNAVRGDTVVLDGTGSSDADGDSLRFAWTIVSKPLGSIAELVPADGVSPGFVADRVGSYQAFTATVPLTAGRNAITASGTVRVYTTESANTPSVTVHGVVATVSDTAFSGCPTALPKRCFKFNATPLLVRGQYTVWAVGRDVLSGKDSRSQQRGHHRGHDQRDRPDHVHVDPGRAQQAKTELAVDDPRDRTRRR